MVTQQMLIAFGQMLKQARATKKLSQQEVAETMNWAQGQYSDIERAYIRPGQSRASVPGDDFIAAVSRVLDLPIRDLHAALGRVPPGGPAAALVNEKIAEYAIHEDVQLTNEQMDALVTDLENYTEYQVTRTMKQSQSQRQSQKQEKSAA